MIRPKKDKRTKKAQREPFDIYFGKPRIEIFGGECIVDGLDSVIEYSCERIKVRLGTQVIAFYGSNLKINSFTREGAVVQGNIESMEFSS